MNVYCILETSILGSEDMLQYTSLISNKMKTPKETDKHTLTMILDFLHLAIPTMP